MRKSIYIFLVTLTLVGCDKDENGPASLISTWTRTEMYSIDGSGNKSHNLHDYSAECEKDNLYQFNENNDFFLKEGNKTCNPSSEKTDKYELIENGSKIKFYKGGIWEITSLTESSLKITQPLPSGTVFREMVTTYSRK